MNALAKLIDAANTLSWPGALLVAVVVIVAAALLVYLIERIW